MRETLRPPKESREHAKGTKKEHIWLRSHNVGSIRAQGKREKAFDADIDVFALQEISAYIRTMHDAKKSSAKSSSDPYGENQRK